MPLDDAESPLLRECDGSIVPNNESGLPDQNEAVVLEPEQAEALRALSCAGLDPTVVAQYHNRPGSNS